MIGHEYKVGGHASSTDERVTEEMWAVQIGSMRDRLPDAKILRLKIMTLPGLEIHLGLRFNSFTQCKDKSKEFLYTNKKEKPVIK